jgi:hypothetical protein
MKLHLEWDIGASNLVNVEGGKGNDHLKNHTSLPSQSRFTCLVTELQVDLSSICLK